jgi:hypothetical protein
MPLPLLLIPLSMWCVALALYGGAVVPGWLRDRRQARARLALPAQRQRWNVEPVCFHLDEGATLLVQDGDVARALPVVLRGKDGHLVQLVEGTPVVRCSVT